MRITVIAVGKLKEKFFQEAVSEYAKRLGRYCRLEIIQVADEKTPDGAGSVLEEQIKAKEGERILSHVREGGVLIALAVEGDMLDSLKLARKIENWGISGNSDLIFIIGGSLGLSAAVLKRADILLSFSRMTFPHQLMRMILLEQIYRSFRIINREPYHK